MPLDYYILDENHKVILAASVEVWAAFFSDIQKRRVGYSYIEIPGDNTRSISISTVFIGTNIDHLFETLVTWRDSEGILDSKIIYSDTWEQAAILHQSTLLGARKDLGVPSEELPNLGYSRWEIIGE